MRKQANFEAGKPDTASPCCSWLQVTAMVAYVQVYMHRFQLGLIANAWDALASNCSQNVGRKRWRLRSPDPTQWGDNGRSKPTHQHPDFRHRKSQVTMSQKNRYRPAWVDSLLGTWGAWMTRPPESASTSVLGERWFGTLELHEDHLKVKMCRKLCEDGRITEAVDALSLLLQRGCHVDKNLFYRALKKCIAQKDLVLGRRIHVLTVDCGYEGDPFLATQLIGLYALHGWLEEAKQVFTRVSTPSSYNWATIIFAYARHGEAVAAIQLYRQMQESTTVEPTDRIYVAVLKACGAARDLVTGKEVHARILESPGKPNIFVQNGLVNMYASCGSLEDARIVFGRLPERNVVTWTTMISAYVQQGLGLEALSLYSSMQEESMTPPDSIAFVCLLQACARVGETALHQGKKLHAQIEELGLRDDVIVGGSLVNMYAKCGSIEDARRMFDRHPARNAVTWNAMLAGYVQKGMGQDALSLYSSMKQEGLTPPDSVAFVCLLQACAGVGAVDHGRQLHAEIEELGLHNDVIVGGSLVNMYVKCGRLEDARGVFDRLPDRNVVIWTTMISGYVEQGMGQEALRLYSSMEQEGIISPNSVTYVCLLQACATVGVGALRKGKQLHAQIEVRGMQDDVVVGGSLVNMYTKCSSLEDACTVFDRLPEKNVVTWTAMISGYAEQGMSVEALMLYSCMQGTIPPNSVTFVCLLQACANAAALPLGKQLHAQIEERGLQADVVVGGSLVHMYAKCGSVFDSQLVFDSLPERTIEAWNALTGGYARQGNSEVVFDLFERMRREGVQPDGITFLNVLTLCSHVGLVDTGRAYFEAMVTKYSISPSIEHYACMMDLLGRAGHLDEALQMAKTMPCPPTGIVWFTLLGACQKWKNVEIAQQVFEEAASLDGKDASSYVLMANIYASAGMWEKAKQMQERRVKFGAWKKPGQSWWTDTSGAVHTFVV